MTRSREAFSRFATGRAQNGRSGFHEVTKCMPSKPLQRIQIALWLEVQSSKAGFKERRHLTDLAEFSTHRFEAFRDFHSGHSQIFPRDLF